MVAGHGILNSIGFVLFSLLALVLIPVKAAPLCLPLFSQIYGKGPIGGDFFERLKFNEITSGSAFGLVDNMSDYQRVDFDPKRLPEILRHFYEKTADFELDVNPNWSLGFRTGGRFYSWLARRWGQMALPVAADERGTEIESRIFPLSSERDGRAKVRAWVRKYKRSSEPLYLAAYANHARDGITYMNIAFPIPGGNVTSILHLQHGNLKSGKESLVLTSVNDFLRSGDQGVFFVNKRLPIRLPINERIEVWEEQGELKATHNMWLLGIKFLTLSYRITN